MAFVLYAVIYVVDTGYIPTTYPKETCKGYFIFYTLILFWSASKSAWDLIDSNVSLALFYYYIRWVDIILISHFDHAI